MMLWYNMCSLLIFLIYVVGQSVAIGGISGAIAQGTIYPMEVIQTRLAVSPAGTYRGIANAFSKIVCQEGYKALFRWALLQYTPSTSVWIWLPACMTWPDQATGFCLVSLPTVFSSIRTDNVCACFKVILIQSTPNSLAWTSHTHNPHKKSLYTLILHNIFTLLCQCMCHLHLPCHTILDSCLSGVAHSSCIPSHKCLQAFVTRYAKMHVLVNKLLCLTWIALPLSQPCDIFVQCLQAFMLSASHSESEHRVPAHSVHNGGNSRVHISVIRALCTPETSILTQKRHPYTGKVKPRNAWAH